MGQTLKPTYFRSHRFLCHFCSLWFALLLSSFLIPVENVAKLED